MYSTNKFKSAIVHLKYDKVSRKFQFDIWFHMSEKLEWWAYLWQKPFDIINKCDSCKTLGVGYFGGDDLSGALHIFAPSAQQHSFFTGWTTLILLNRQITEVNSNSVNTNSTMQNSLHNA